MPDPTADPLGLRPGPDASRARRRTYEVIFEHETAGGRAFDVALIAAILASVAAVMLESVASVRLRHGTALRVAEWGFTVAFTVEYLLRLWCVRRPGRYAGSFLGVVDVLSILPTWLSVVFPGGQVLSVVRILRVLRVFRVLKLVQYVGEARVLGEALRASRYKITVFLISVVTIVVIVGSLMYLVEGPESGFTSIPQGVYWAVVTLTTVGFGDVTPRTPQGQALAALVMVMGYAIIAVPTGIVTVELAGAGRAALASGRRCARCGRGGHDGDAVFCKWCGEALAAPPGGGEPGPGSEPGPSVTGSR